MPDQISTVLHILSDFLVTGKKIVAMNCAVVQKMCLLVALLGVIFSTAGAQSLMAYPDSIVRAVDDSKRYMSRNPTVVRLYAESGIALDSTQSIGLLYYRVVDAGNQNLIGKVLVDTIDNTQLINAFNARAFETTNHGFGVGNPRDTVLAIVHWKNLYSRLSHSSLGIREFQEVSDIRRGDQYVFKLSERVVVVPSLADFQDVLQTRRALQDGEIDSEDMSRAMRKLDRRLGNDRAVRRLLGW